MTNSLEVKTSYFAASAVFVVNIFYELFSFAANPHDFLIITNAFILSISAVLITFLATSIASNLSSKSDQTTTINETQRNLLVSNIVIFLVCIGYTYFFEEPTWFSQLANAIQIVSGIMMAFLLILISKNK